MAPTTRPVPPSIHSGNHGLTESGPEAHLQSFSLTLTGSARCPAGARCPRRASSPVALYMSTRPFRTLPSWTPRGATISMAGSTASPFLSKRPSLTSRQKGFASFECTATGAFRRGEPAPRAGCSWTTAMPGSPSRSKGEWPSSSSMSGSMTGARGPGPPDENVKVICDPPLSGSSMSIRGGPSLLAESLDSVIAALEPPFAAEALALIGTSTENFPSTLLYSTWMLSTSAP
mmetsp:Transcript_37545/g.107508  ORF Transcript_37545/g.107508 Transcript_37545/m.107508 type:complete len:232 (+) Transcript_37545:235-930(+)